MRETWTDERLDDLNARVDRGFERVDADLRSLRAETKAGFDRVDASFEAIDARFEAMYRLMLQLGGLVVAALIGLIATQL